MSDRPRRPAAMNPAPTTGPADVGPAGDPATLEALAGLVSDRPLDRLAAMVAAHLDAPRARVHTVQVDTHPYDLPAITTAGRFRVSGTAHAESGEPVRYSFFVKVVQSYTRSPLSQQLPAALRDRVAPLVPWRTEPDLYRTDLADRLPDGLTVPRAYGVYDLDEDSAAIWLEMLPTQDITWRLPQHRRAAYLLGRLAANPAVAPLAAAVPVVRTARNFVRWWLEYTVIPNLYDDRLWQRPPVAGTFDGRLRTRMIAAVGALPELLDELESLPTATAHGDACTRNLLIREPDGRLALIDFGFWGTAPVGFDLGQLLLGEIQLGQRPAGLLPRLENECLRAYVRGLRDEGSTVSHTQVRRAHALLLTIHHAIPAIPFEHLTTEPSRALHRLFENRAQTTRFILDLLDATGPAAAPENHRAAHDATRPGARCSLHSPHEAGYTGGEL
ncbi:MAG TPA: phosphotransferase [Nakamurella sp.]